MEDFLVVVSVTWAPRAADPSIYPLIAIDMFPSQKVVDFELIDIYDLYLHRRPIYSILDRYRGIRILKPYGSSSLTLVV